MSLGVGLALGCATVSLVAAGTGPSVAAHWGRVPAVVGVSKHSASGRAMVAYSVSAVDADDVWVVGVGSGDSDQQAQVLRWDGASWQDVPVPPLGEASQLYTIDALDTGDVWAAGSFLDDTGHHSLMLHWEGTRWIRVDAPGAGSFSDIDATSPSDVWAVGGDGLNGFVDHWDGSAWSSVQDSRPKHTHSAVTALGPDDAWAIGIRSYHTAQRTYGEHWDGTSWSRVDMVNPDPKNSRLDGVAATPSGTVFAVGSWGGSGGLRSGGAARSRHSLIERWDGDRWTKVAAPSPGGATALYGVCAVNGRRGVGGR